DLREELAGAPDERLALGILVSPRALADEHQTCLRIAHAEHEVGPMRGELAALAVADRGAQRVQRSRPCHAGLGEQRRDLLWLRPRRGRGRARGPGRAFLWRRTARAVAHGISVHPETPMILELGADRRHEFTDAALSGLVLACTLAGQCRFSA